MNIYKQVFCIISMENNPHRRSGGLLERTLANIFKNIGFDVSVNSKEFGFEADIIAKKDTFTILIEAKQHDNSYINVGSLLHEWCSKGKSAGVDRTLVVITGMEIPHKSYDLAKQLGVFLWDESMIHKLNDLETKSQVYNKVCLLLGFGEIMERFKMIDEANLNQIQKAILQDDKEIGAKELKKKIREIEKQNKVEREKKNE